MNITKFFKNAFYSGIAFSMVLAFLFIYFKPEKMIYAIPLLLWTLLSGIGFIANNKK